MEIGNKLQDLKPLLNINYLTKDWLQCLLKNYYLKIIDLSFDFTCPSEKEGFLSEISFVDAVFKVSKDGKTETIKESLVFKFFPKDSAKLEFMKNGSLGMREVDFYRFAASVEFKNVQNGSKLLMVLPFTLCSLIDKSHFTIVMKDLRTLNYKVDISKDGSSFIQTKLVLSSIAVVHAAGLRSYEKHGKFPLKKYEDISFFLQFLEPNLKILADIFKDDIDMYNTLCKLQPYGKEILMTLSKNVLLETVIHGDLWAGQCMFSENDDEACILDWQFANIGNPVIDLMSMFGMSTSPDVLKNDLDTLLLHYWNVLKTCLQKHEINLKESYSQFLDNIEANWMIGFFALTASLHDFLGANISDKRLKDLMHFFQKKNVFSNFLAEHDS